MTLYQFVVLNFLFSKTIEKLIYDRQSIFQTGVSTKNNNRLIHNYGIKYDNTLQ